MPYHDYWLYTVIPDPATRLANFRAGKIHQLSISMDQYDLVKDDKSIYIAKQPGRHWSGLTFNMVEGPCKDIRIRKAVTHAIDKKALIHGILFGLATEASGPYPGFHWTHNPNLKPRKYDPELSKKLLAEAGYKKGLTIKGHADSTSVSWIEAIQAMLKKVGIKWEVDYLDGPAASDRLNNLEFEMRSGGYSWITEPDLMATAYFHSEGNWNRGRYVNPEMDELIVKGRSIIDMEKRQKHYQDIEKRLVEDYTDVFIYWPTSVTIRHKVLAGYNNKIAVSGGVAAYHAHPEWFVDGKGEVKY
jgi:peptide/nickel transport system substrate-binding protein